jgi:hypothetical protein
MELPHLYTQELCETQYYMAGLFSLLGEGAHGKLQQLLLTKENKRVHGTLGRSPANNCSMVASQWHFD